MIQLLTTYWLEGLLAVILFGSLAYLLAKQLRLQKQNKALYKAITHISPKEWIGVDSWGDYIDREIYKMGLFQKDYAALKSRLDLLDKPSNDRALASIAKKLNAKTFSKQPTKLIRPKAAKANGRSHASR